MGRYQWVVGLEEQSMDDVDLTALENPENAVEAKTIECAEADASVDSLAADGEQLEEDTGALEEIAGAVETAEADGGMDETAARVVDVAVEAIAARWGIRRRKVGLENFTGAYKARSTSVALEGIIDTIKEMWQRFVEWIGEVVNKLKDFWLKYFNAGKAIQKRADRLEASLDKGLGEKSKDQIDGSWTKKLQVNGKLDIAEVYSFAKEGKSGISVKAMVDYTADLGEAIATGKVTKSMSDRLNEIQMGTKTTKSFKAMLPSDAQLATVNAMPGGYYLVTYKRSDIDFSKEDSEAGKKPPLSVKVIQVDEITGDKKLPTPSAKDMYDAVKHIRMIGESLEEDLKDFRKIDDKLASARDKAKSAGNDLKGAAEDKREELRIKLRIANNALANILQIRRIATTVPQEAAAGLIGYVQAGISAHKSVKA